MNPINSNSINAPEEDYLYTQKSLIPNSGLGLFTAINIYKDEIIALFKGEILTPKQAIEREVKGMDHYFMNLHNGSILDSMHTECFAKYANDANGLINSSFKNNARITLDDHNNVCIVATRKIKAFEELFCSYGKRYWAKHG